jgi:hypothetical protein
MSSWDLAFSGSLHALQAAFLSGLCVAEITEQTLFIKGRSDFLKLGLKCLILKV